MFHMLPSSAHNHAFWLLWTNSLLRSDINEIETAVYQINRWVKVTWISHWYAIFWCLIGWVKIQGAESALIKASLKSQDVSYDCIGTVIAKHGCWSFLKGGFVVTSPSSFSILTLQVNIFLTLFNTFNLIRTLLS